MYLLVIITMQLLHDFRSHPEDARDNVTSIEGSFKQRMKITLHNKNNDTQINRYKIFTSKASLQMYFLLFAYFQYRTYRLTLQSLLA